MIRVFTLTAITWLFATGVVLATDSPTVQGEYLEARSSSVYIGACHYGAEFMEGGKEATLVWNIEQGKWKGVSLNGLTVVAVVSAKCNLAIDTQTRQSALYIDAGATAEQRAALINLITAKRRTVVGEIIHTKVVPIAFVKEGVEYEVHVGEALDLTATRYPCQYCTQPHQIWYKPLEQVDNAVVGKSKVYRYEDAILPTTWNQGEPANNVFVGKFTM